MQFIQKLNYYIMFCRWRDLRLFRMFGLLLIFQLLIGLTVLTFPSQSYASNSDSIPANNEKLQNIWLIWMSDRNDGRHELYRKQMETGEITRMRRITVAKFLYGSLDRLSATSRWFGAPAFLGWRGRKKNL